MLYRIRQALHAIRAASTPIDEEAAAAVLSPPLLTLFRSMRRSEQAHALNVLHSVRTLWCAEYNSDPPLHLETAALLHDVGKSRYPLALWGRSIPVAVSMIAPSWVERLAKTFVSPSPFWRGGRGVRLLFRPFAIYVYHPAWGAEMAQDAGGSSDAVWLIEHHADDVESWRDHALYKQLCFLWDADGMN